MAHIPILTDTEAETSIEHDGIDDIDAKVNTVTRGTRISLYNISFDNFINEKRKSVELRNYEERLHREMKDWKNVLYNAYQDIKKSKEPHALIDKTILPPEKMQYLEKAHNLQSFIRESLEFREKVLSFINKDHAEIVDMVSNLEGLCESRINSVKLIKLSEYLDNY